MPSEWINLDKLGTKGMEPDLMPPHREPQSLDEAVNVRAVGPNLANAGGYSLVSGLPTAVGPPPAVVPEEPGAASPCIVPIPPNEAMRLFKLNGTYAVNRYYAYDWAVKDDFIVTVPIGLYQKEYDVSTLMPQVGLDQEVPGGSSYLGGIRLSIRNSSGLRDVRLEALDGDGVVSSVELEYDATVEFTDGSVHWVTWRIFRSGGFPQAIVFLDGTQLYANNYPDIVNEEVYQVTVSNYDETEWLQFAMWHWSQPVWDCLTSGNFESLGGVDALDLNPDYRYDPAISSAAHIFQWENMVAIATEPDSVDRIAYLDFTKPISGRRYFEVFSVVGRAGNPPFREGSSIDTVNNQLNGEYLQSWGFQDEGSVLRINGDDVPFGANLLSLRCYAVDYNTGDLWIGEISDLHVSGATRSWVGGADPDVGDPAPYNIYTTGPVSPYSGQICIGRFDPGMRVELFSNPNGCTFLLPTGFGYLIKK